jgi:hypothetical protein
MDLLTRSPRFHNPLLEPPAHVLAEVDAAWERAHDRFAGELELHFTIDSFTKRVAGELRCADGSHWASLSATEALAFACGDAALL